MTSDEQKGMRRGPAVLAALLLSFLLGGPAPASVVASSASADLTQPQAGKSTVLARSLRRAGEEEADVDDLSSPELGYAPEAEVARPALGPVADVPSAPAIARVRARPSPFNARAPPAA